MLFKGTGISLGEINSVLQAGMNNPDLGTLCKHQNLNPWAKFKPFRYNSIAFSSFNEWESAMKSANYGFGNIIAEPTSLSDESMIFYWSGSSKPWITNYFKPRGGSYNEFYRQLDFVDLSSGSNYGYYADAVPPLNIAHSDDNTYVKQAGDNVLVKYNYQANINWSSNTCLSMSELLFKAIDSSTKTYNLAVLFKPAGHPELNNLLVTNIEAGDFAALTPSEFEIPFTGIAESGSQSTGIYIPALGDNGQGSGSRDGDMVSMTVCMAENVQPQGTDNYRLIDNSGGLQTTRLLSLNLYDGIDLKNLPIIANNSIQGSAATISSVTFTDLGSVTEYSGSHQSYRVIRINDIYVTTTLKGPHWGTRNTINCMFFVDLSNSTADLGTYATYYSDAELEEEGPMMGGAGGLIIRTAHQASSQGDVQEMYATVNATNLNQQYLAMSYSAYDNNGKIRYPCLYVWPVSGSGARTLTISGIMFTGNPNNPKPNGGIQLTPYTTTITL